MARHIQSNINAKLQINFGGVCTRLWFAVIVIMSERDMQLVSSTNPTMLLIVDGVSVVLNIIVGSLILYNTCASWIYEYTDLREPSASLYYQSHASVTNRYSFVRIIWTVATMCAEWFFFRISSNESHKMNRYIYIYRYSGSGCMSYLLSITQTRARWFLEDSFVTRSWNVCDICIEFTLKDMAIRFYVVLFTCAIISSFQCQIVDNDNTSSIFIISGSKPRNKKQPLNNSIFDCGAGNDADNAADDADAADDTDNADDAYNVKNITIRIVIYNCSRSKSRCVSGIHP